MLSTVTTTESGAESAWPSFTMSSKVRSSGVLVGNVGAGQDTEANDVARNAAELAGHDHTDTNQ